MDRYKKIIIITGIIGAVLICWGFLYSQADRKGLPEREADTFSGQWNYGSGKGSGEVFSFYKTFLGREPGSG